jgi:hypothetical protein
MSLDPTVAHFGWVMTQMNFQSAPELGSIVRIQSAKFFDGHLG